MPPTTPDPTDSSSNWKEHVISITWNNGLCETVDLDGVTINGVTVAVAGTWNKGLVAADVVQYQAFAKILPDEQDSVYELHYAASAPSNLAEDQRRRCGSARITFHADRPIEAIWTDENGKADEAAQVSVVEKPSDTTVDATHVQIKNKVSLTAFLSSLDCRLRIGFYWSATSENQKRIIVTVWDDEVDNRKYVLLPKDDLPWKFLPGAYELRRHIPLALKADAEVFGVICHAVNTAAGTRKRAYYNELELVKLQIREVGGAWIAELGDFVSVQQLRDGVPLTPTTGDAFNDLDVPMGQINPLTASTAAGRRFIRDAMVREFVVSRAQGRCEHCDAEAFIKENGQPYLEGHHVDGLAAGGPDTVDNVIALCPNDHREAHYGRKRAELNKKMLGTIRERNLLFRQKR